MDSYSNNSTRVRFTTTAYLEGSHQPFTTHYLALNNNVNKSFTTASYEFAPNSVVSNSHSHRPYSNQNHSFSNISNAASNTTVTSQATAPVQQQHFVHQHVNIHQIPGMGSQNTNSLYKASIEAKAINHRPAMNSQTCTDWSIHPSDSFITNTFTNSITTNKNRNTPVSAATWNNVPHFNGPQHQPANFVKESMMNHRNPASHHTYQRTHQSYYMNASGDHSWSHPQNSNLAVTATQPHNYNPSPLRVPSSYPQSRVFPNLPGHINHSRGSTGDNSRINQPITPAVANIHATPWNPPNPNLNMSSQWNNSTNSWSRDENQNTWNGFDYSSHHSNAISTSSLISRRDDPLLATGFEPWRYSPTAVLRQPQIPVSDGPNRPEYGLNTIETWKPSDIDRISRNGNHNKFPRFNRIDGGPRIRMLQNCRQIRGDRDQPRELWSPSESKKKDKQQQQRSYNTVSSSTNDSEVADAKSSEVIVKSCSKKSEVETQLIEVNELQTILDNWLASRHFKSSTSTKSSDEKSTTNFKTEIRIVDQKFIGIGSSSNKVESELVAMWNLLETLVAEGQMDKQHLPDRRTTSTFTNNNEETESDKKSSISSSTNSRKTKTRPNNQSVKTSTNKIPSLLSIVLPPRQNLPTHSFIYDTMYEPWGNTPPHPQPWCPRAPWIDHINHLGPHPTGLVPYRDRPMVPWTSNPPHHMPPLPSNDMDMVRMSRGWVEDLNPESEMISPEDVFIHRMIMNQKEATRCTAGHNPSVMRSQMSPPLPDILPGEWGAPAPANKSKQTLDDKHVMSKHADVFPTENELKNIHEVVEVIEKSLKSLSDQFVDEDHPLPPKSQFVVIADDVINANIEDEDQDDDKSADQMMESDKERGDGDKAAEKLVSDEIVKSNHEKRVEKKPKFQILKRPKSAPKKVPDTRPRVLNGVNRIGVFSKGLLVHGDSLVELVLLCGQIPTYRLLDRILKHLPEKINEVKKELKFNISKNKAGFTIVTKCDVPVKLVITLTSTSLKLKRSNNETKSVSSTENETPDSTISSTNKPEVQQKNTANDVSSSLPTSDFPDDALPKSSQLSALAELRHTKWFQSRAIQQESCPIIIRLLREMQTRVPVWAALSCWALENLVYLALSSSTERMRHGDAFRRLFEVVAGGILLPDGPGLLDPCEREPVDVLSCCSPQQLEDVTRHAQHALLLITFRSIHEVLGMPKISSHNARHQTNLKSSNKKQKTVFNDDNCGCKSTSTQSCLLTTAAVEDEMQKLKITPAIDVDQTDPLSNCQQNGFNHPTKQTDPVLERSLNESKSALEDQKPFCPTKPLTNDEVNNKDEQIKI